LVSIQKSLIDSSTIPCYVKAMRKRITHIAWDFGIIQDTVSDILGFFPGQKTTKTICKKRVVMKNIDNKNPSCPECSEWLKRNPEPEYPKHSD
jgi:hypothetical protein